MAWIKFEAARVKRLEKFYEFRREMGWSSVEALGFLGSFWGEAIEVCEGGDVTGWTPGYVSELTGLAGSAAERAWAALAKHGWLDKRGDRLLIHDWIDVAGAYLRKKYEGPVGSAPRGRLVEIWAQHGLIYGGKPTPDPEPTGNRPTPDPEPTVDKTREDESRPEHKTVKARFAAPTLEDVRAYCSERKNSVDPQKWLDHYTANGWRVGRNPMKDWRAAVRTWERMAGDFAGAGARRGGGPMKPQAPGGKYDLV